MRTKKETKNKRIMDILLSTLLELLLDIKYEFIESLDKIAIVIQVLIPVILSRVDCGIVIILIVSILFTLSVRYIKEVSYKINNVTDRGFPVPSKRYTNVDENGFIGVEEDLMQEAILYLFEIEEYIKRKGLR